MARKTNTKVTNAKGKSYDYCRISPYVEKYNEETGEWYKSRKQFYGNSEKEAKAKLDAYNQWVEEEKRKQQEVSFKREHLDQRSFGEYLKWYIENVFVPNNAIRPATKVRYINSYTNIFDNQSILKLPVGIVTGEDLQEVFTNAEAAPSSREAALKLIRNFYKYLSAQKITSDVTHGIIIPHAETKRQDQSVETYSDAELKIFQNDTPQDHRLRLMIILAIYTGARIAELAALSWDDIDIKREQIIINKSLSEIPALKTDIEAAKKKGLPLPKKLVEISDTKSIDSVRSVPINKIIIKEIKRHKAWQQSEMMQNGYRTNYLFTTKTGELYYKSNLRTALNRLCKKLGIESKGWHCFRHTYGSKLAANGVPIQTVSKLMGHSDISVTAKYYLHINTDEKKAALEKFVING